MGATTIVSGMQPGVVSALIDLDADTDGVLATATLDDAFALMHEIQSPASDDAVGEPMDAEGSEAVSHDEPEPPEQVSSSLAP
jgi:hypothetical protein